MKYKHSKRKTKKTTTLESTKNITQKDHFENNNIENLKKNKNHNEMDWGLYFLPFLISIIIFIIIKGYEIFESDATIGEKIGLTLTVFLMIWFVVGGLFRIIIKLKRKGLSDFREGILTQILFLIVGAIEGAIFLGGLALPFAFLGEIENPFIFIGISIVYFIFYLVIMDKIFGNKYK